jgi:selenocysteine-specific elongation factor
VGAVVTGTVFSGSVKTGDSLILFPAEMDTQVKGLQVHNQTVTEASAGQRLAINLGGGKIAEIKPGQVLCSREHFLPTRLLDVTLTLLPGAPKVTNKLPVRLYLATAELTGKITLLDRPALNPGETGMVQFRSGGTMIARRGDRYIIRTMEAESTLGGGEVLDVHPLVHRHRSRLPPEYWRQLAADDPESRVVFELEKARTIYSIPELGIILSLPIADLNPAVDALAANQSVIVWAVGQTRWCLGRQTREALLARLRGRVEDFHGQFPLITGGLPRSRVLAEIIGFLYRPGLGQDILDDLYQLLTHDPGFRDQENTLALATHAVNLSRQEARQRQEILRQFTSQPLSPPPLSYLLKIHPSWKGMLDAMIKTGELISGGEGIFFVPPAAALAEKNIREYLIKNNRITVSEFGKLMGTSRRYSMPLLHILEASKILRREGDYRHLI